VNRRVVITGIGVIAPNGVGAEPFWKNCCAATLSVEPIPAHWLDYAPLGSTLWAPLPPIDFTQWGIDRIQQQQLDPVVMLTLAAAAQALDHAQLRAECSNQKKNLFCIPALNPQRAGVFMGSGNGGLSSLVDSQISHVGRPIHHQLGLLHQQLSGLQLPQQLCLVKQAQDHLRLPERFNPFAVSMTMPNAISATLGIHYGLRGTNATLCCACAAGAMAVGTAYEAIARGTLDLALCGGAEFLGDRYGAIFRAFDTAKTLVRRCEEPLRANRPFDRDRSGFLFAQGGAAVLVVEEYEHACRRGAQAIAEIGAFEQSFDCFSIMSPEPQGCAIKRMLHRVLEQAELYPAHVDYVNAHATATVLNDALEASIIEDVFGKDVFVNATKSLTGHTIGASGALEAAVTALAIRDDMLHPCANLDTPLAPLNFVRSLTRTPINYAVTQSFGFGGHNAALLLKKVLAR
jgi:3-oxoacyl-[acyl-carrier-protein] synthase II